MDLGLGLVNWHYIKGCVAVAVIFFFTGFGTCLWATARSTGHRPRELVRRMISSKKRNKEE